MKYKATFKKRLILFLFFFIFPFNAQAQKNVSLNDLIGKIYVSHNSSFLNLETLHIPTSRDDMFLRLQAAYALQKAYQNFHTKNPEIPFIIVSATRSYDHQQLIWNKKWSQFYKESQNNQKTALKILKFSSMPATSRHHFGTDVDITNLNNSYFETGKGLVLYHWLTTHMKDYGFCQPYTAGRNGGYAEEKWHWSYKPLAHDFLNAYQLLFNRSPEKIMSQMQFLGSHALPLKDYIKEYVFNINPNCL